MKNILLTSVALISFSLSARAEFLIQPNDVLGICGDSITEQHLYTCYMEEYLLMCQPTAGQKIVQFGWGGETAPGFLARLDTDFFPFKPTVATTCYGMNDGHYASLTDDTADTYRKAQTDIVEAMKKNGVRAIVLGSAKCVDSHYFHNDPAQAEIYNKTLNSMADIDRDIAAKEGVLYADVYGNTYDVMTKAKAKWGDDYSFAGGDGVHPGQACQLLMAYTFLKALGCDGNIGTIMVEYGLNKATGSPGQEIVSYKDGVVDVKSTRYPFCFTGQPDSKNPPPDRISDAKDPNITASITTVFPFNQDLNRYTLVVKGLTTPKAKVTWGSATKEYASADLAKGVNLADDFMVTPFADQFNKVENAVHQQEDQETMLYKIFLHNKTDWSANFAPGTAAAFDQIIAAGMTKHDQLFKSAADLVIPLEHTIKIEPES